MNDHEGNKPKWWQWLISGLMIVAGVVLCATGVGAALGVSLLVAGGSMMASNIMSAAGVNGKVASIISSSLNIVAGIALCFTPFAAMGASMIGSGIGGIAGGFISEALGGSFETGAMIGAIVGGIIGGQVYKGVQAASAARAAKATASAAAGSKSTSSAASASSATSGTAASKGAAGEKYISELTGYTKNTEKVLGTQRIPDFYEQGSYLIESKNVARQALTSQLRDYMNIAKSEGVVMELFVRQGTKLTSSLKQVVNAGEIILKFFPW